MAYAYQELAQTTDGESASVFAAHARLRASLAAVARSAFDVLSQSPDGSLSLDELMTALPAGTTLEMIEHALERGVEGLGEACLSLSEKPLAVIPGPPVRLQLSSAACSAWRALVHAEQLSAAA
jgi:hypothetical protein